MAVPPVGFPKYRRLYAPGSQTAHKTRARDKRRFSTSPRRSCSLATALHLPHGWPWETQFSGTLVRSRGRPLPSRRYSQGPTRPPDHPTPDRSALGQLQLASHSTLLRQSCPEPPPWTAEILLAGSHTLRANRFMRIEASISHGLAAHSGSDRHRRGLRLKVPVPGWWDTLPTGTLEAFFQIT